MTRKEHTQTASLIHPEMKGILIPKVVVAGLGYVPGVC